jgi:site-specific recombinase XerD
MTRQTLREKGMPPALGLNIEEILENYRFCLQAANRSPKTIDWYIEILRRFFAFLKAKSLLKPLGELSPNELRAYIRYLQQATRWEHHPQVKKAGGKLSAFSIQGHVRAIKAFFSFLASEGCLASNPLARFPLPSVPQKPVATLSEEQIERLFANIDRSSPIGAKYSAIVHILLDTGMRISELTQIRLDELDLGLGWVRVTGKGQKIRLVPLTAPCRKEIRRYISLFRHQTAPVDSPFLFAQADGESISANSVEQFLRRLATAARLKGVRCSPHVFRHTFATQYIANGGNVFVLKEILGHSSLQTTMKYVHLRPQDIQIQHSRFSPLARMSLRGVKSRKPGLGLRRTRRSKINM